MHKHIFSISFVGLLMLLSQTMSSSAQVQRNTAEYNLDANQLGLKGYDPVAVFPEGGAQALRGDPQITVHHLGVIYSFASTDNRDLFLQNPEKYEPTYGGWCAYAMAQGSKVDILPTLFTVNGNRAHYFVANRAKRSFDRDIADHEDRADQIWRGFSGEEPRK